MKKVMIFGTFDLLHIGHLNFIKDAADLGDELLVVLARDVNVKKLKDIEPFHSEEERKEIIDSIEFVDEAILGSKYNVYKVIKDNEPDMIALGYDQKHFIDKLEPKLEEFGLNTKIVRLEPHQGGKHKSSKLREKYNI